MQVWCDMNNKKRSIEGFWYEVGKRFERDNDDIDNIQNKEDLKNKKVINNE